MVDKVKKTRKPKASNTPENETKAQKFTRIIKTRGPKAVKAIGAVRNLAGKGYESTDEQVEKILAAFDNAVTDLRVEFESRNKQGDAAKTEASIFSDL